ncbi:uncharacterized protein LOC116286635 [Actinia tenebrosa]|uniref:Uncharacterized protein LOC116286635 n=1 Tax=Actinia tenebrosa TaxID=6105 RepID=A0A6P8H0Z4_ACTTE|nr:uncharacterized protein LOC116286635 [Actinia tenebrosa]
MSPSDLLSMDRRNIETIKKNGSTIRLLRGAITDNTGTIKVRFWDPYCDLQSGRAYSFANLKVRQYSEHKYLTTAPSTVADEIDEEFPVPDEDELNDVTTIRVEGFKMINNYATWYTCLNCSKHVTDVPTLKSAKCNNCKAIMLLEACPKMMSVKVAICDPSNEESYLWLTIFRDVLTQMIPPAIRKMR